jgi:hypothetical protein
MIVVNSDSINFWKFLIYIFLRLDLFPYNYKILQIYIDRLLKIS